MKTWCKYNITKQNITSAILFYDDNGVTFLKRTTESKKNNLSFWTIPNLAISLALRKVHMVHLIKNKNTTSFRSLVKITETLSPFKKSKAIQWLLPELLTIKESCNVIWKDKILVYYLKHCASSCWKNSFDLLEINQLEFFSLNYF